VNPEISESPHSLLKLVNANRLGDECIGPLCIRSVDIFLSIARRKHYDRDLAKYGVFAHLVQNGKAIFIGHVNVKQNEVRGPDVLVLAFPPQESHGFNPIGGNMHQFNGGYAFKDVPNEDNCHAVVIN
jgi:hypothetical protein